MLKENFDIFFCLNGHAQLARFESLETGIVKNVKVIEDRPFEVAGNFLQNESSHPYINTVVEWINGFKRGDLIYLNYGKINQVKYKIKNFEPDHTGLVDIRVTVV